MYDYMCLVARLRANPHALPMGSAIAQIYLPVPEEVLLGLEVDAALTTPLREALAVCEANMHGLPPIESCLEGDVEGDLHAFPEEGLFPVAVHKPTDMRENGSSVVVELDPAKSSFVVVELHHASGALDRLCESDAVRQIWLWLWLRLFGSNRNEAGQTEVATRSFPNPAIIQRVIGRKVVYDITSPQLLEERRASSAPACPVFLVVPSRHEPHLVVYRMVRNEIIAF